MTSNNSNYPKVLDIGDGISIPEKYLFIYNEKKSPVEITKDEFKYFKRKKIVKGLYEKGKLRIDLPDRPSDYSEASGVPDDLIAFRGGDIIKVGIKANLPEVSIEPSNAKDSTKLNLELLKDRKRVEKKYRPYDFDITYPELEPNEAKIQPKSSCADELISNTGSVPKTSSTANLSNEVDDSPLPSHSAEYLEMQRKLEELEKANIKLREKNKRLRSATISETTSDSLESLRERLLHNCSSKKILDCIRLAQDLCIKNNNDWTIISNNDFGSIVEPKQVSDFKRKIISLGIMLHKKEALPGQRKERNFYKLHFNEKILLD